MGKSKSQEHDKFINWKILTLPFIAIISFGILTSFVSSMPQHFPGYAGTIGLSTTVGASLLSMGMIGNIISKLVIGAFSDKIGSIKATFVLIFSKYYWCCIIAF